MRVDAMPQWSAQPSRVKLAEEFAAAIPAQRPPCSLGVCHTYWPEPKGTELWYARNAIYAEKGYCFKTKRARRVFGKACFPPYGKLSGSEQSRVNRIVREERRKGCR